jgi:hypothetical protein
MRISQVIVCLAPIGHTAVKKNGGGNQVTAVNIIRKSVVGPYDRL